MSTSDPSDKNFPAGEKAKQQIAIALEDTPESETAPRITATGKGAVAEQIIAIALASGVKVRKDADLAEVLSVLEVDSVVPVEVLATISEILAYVYRANAARLPQTGAS